MLKYLLVWIVMLLASITNGAIRDLTYGNYINELSAHQLSTVSSIIILGFIVWISVERLPLKSAQQAITVGLLWTSLTVAFEFIFFHYVGSHTWAELLSNYNVFNGRVWVAVLVWIAIAPYVFYRIKRRA